jgi:excisionase family DNA binding protein
MPPLEDKLMTPKEVAELFKVNTRTVNKWAREGRIAGVQTPGGHYRFWRSEIARLLVGGSSGSKRESVRQHV